MTTGTHKKSLKTRIRELYEGQSKRAHRFRYVLLVFDLATITFLITSSFFTPSLVTESIDVLIGIGILLDFSARIWISRNRFHDLIHPAGIADMIVIASLLAPVVGEGLAFLRAVRTLRERFCIGPVYIFQFQSHPVFVNIRFIQIIRII